MTTLLRRWTEFLDRPTDIKISLHPAFSYVVSFGNSGAYFAEIRRLIYASQLAYPRNIYVLS
jgi:hypothetical protein